uniref:Uncharacterized protein n=1 Tax=Ditylum brightwellii TaxID=49249 RepID=A0A6V2AXM3_9STRA
MSSPPNSSKLIITVKKRKGGSDLKKRQGIISKNKKRKNKNNATVEEVPSILRSKPPSPMPIPQDDQHDKTKKLKEEGSKIKEEEDEFEFSPLSASDTTAIELPCDALLAVRSLLRRDACCYVHIDSSHTPTQTTHVERRRCGIPFVLRPMIHYSLLSTVSSSSNSAKHNKILSANASTGVTMELNSLQSQNKIRLLQLHGTNTSSSSWEEDREEDVAVMETHHYAQGVWDAFHLWCCNSNTYSSATTKCDIEQQQHQTKQFIQLFIASLPHMTGTTVTESMIQNAFMSQMQQQKQHSFTLPASLSSPQKQIDKLIDLGLLLPKQNHHRTSSSSCSTYWFTFPKMGLSAKQIAKARSRIFTKLRRSMYKEIKRSVLESKDPDGVFVVRDLLSRGKIKICVTTSGEEFVRLVDGM